MVTLEVVLPFASVVASVLLLYFALRLALMLRGGKAWGFTWWIVAAAVAFAVHSTLFSMYARFGGGENPLEVMSDLGHLVAIALLAVGLWRARRFWERGGLS